MPSAQVKQPGAQLSGDIISIIRVCSLRTVSCTSELVMLRTSVASRGRGSWLATGGDDEHCFKHLKLLYLFSANLLGAVQ